MILRITVPDETYEAYGKLNPKNPRKVMEETLEKFKGINPARKTLVLEGEILSMIQGLLKGSPDSPEAFLEALKRALLVRVDDVEVELTEAQRKKLITQAHAWNRPINEFVAQQVRDNLRSL